jgi:cytochrome c oxidase subunit II
MDPGGPQAARLRMLILVFVIICAVVWLLVMAALGGAILRRRATPPGATAERKATTIVAIAVAATVAIITGLTVASYVMTRSLAAAGTAPLVIAVRGHQWWWEVRYEDESPSENFITANEIHVPTGRPIRIKLAADDVIHSFWAPNLDGKQDLIPGRDNALQFTIDRPATYRQQCAEFCGLQHAHMAMLIVAEAPADFARWRAAQLAPARPPTADDERAGEQVFLAKPCAACHSIRGTPAAGTLGPDLTHVGGRQTVAAGMLATTHGALAAWIADPQTIKPGNNMPMVPLTASELNAVAAYLAALK